MKMIADAGLTAEPLADGAQLIAGRYTFFPTIGFWRASDGLRCGYGVRTLIASAKA
jgi:hypothetical protein